MTSKRNLTRIPKNKENAQEYQGCLVAVKLVLVFAKFGEIVYLHAICGLPQIPATTQHEQQ